jgi:hypothetical protein
MTFDEIEDCFPDGGIYETDDGAGITTSAQWLHDFAKNVAAKEREACAKVCDRQAELQDRICSGDDVINQAKRCARDIRNRNGR